MSSVLFKPTKCSYLVLAASLCVGVGSPGWWGASHALHPCQKRTASSKVTHQLSTAPQGPPPPLHAGTLARSCTGFEQAVTTEQSYLQLLCCVQKTMLPYHYPLPLARVFFLPSFKRIPEPLEEGV